MWCKHKVQMSTKMKIYRCELCEYTCDRITRFEEHMTMHKGERNFICQTCGKGFLKKNTLRGHILWVHKEKTIHCDYCDHVTSTVANLREHVRIMHTHRNVKPFKCAYCDYHCLTAGNCRKHVAVRHKELPVKVVKVCDKFPDNSRPILGAERERNPHRPQTIASFDYNVQALMESQTSSYSSRNAISSVDEMLDSNLLSVSAPANMVGDVSAAVTQAMYAISPGQMEVPPTSIASQQQMVAEIQPGQPLQSLPPPPPSQQQHQATVTPSVDGKQAQLISAPVHVLPSMYSLSAAGNIALAPQASDYQLYNLVPQADPGHGAI